MKRFFDIVLSFIGFVVLMPIILIISTLVIARMGSPIFYIQDRVGLHNKLFKIYKFRTMNNRFDNKGNLLPDYKRLDTFGSFLRSTSLDELPGLWCVIKGDMSLVGPRPLLVEYLPLYSKKQIRRHEVKPGITGWAQVNGRNSISWEEKFNLDIWYVENNSIWLDMKIIWMTILKVILREGINQQNHTSMEKFTGINDE